MCDHRGKRTSVPVCVVACTQYRLLVNTRQDMLMTDQRRNGMLAVFLTPGATRPQISCGCWNVVHVADVMKSMLARCQETVNKLGWIGGRIRRPKRHGAEAT